MILLRAVQFSNILDMFFTFAVLKLVRLSGCILLQLLNINAIFSTSSVFKYSIPLMFVRFVKDENQ